MITSKNIIVLAGTKWQIPLVKKIKENGYNPIVFNLLPDSPAFDYADDFRVVDILNVEDCIENAVDFNPIAFMSDECDIAIPSIAALSEYFHLNSIGEEMAELYTNKYKMRLFGQAKGFDTPLFFKCDTVNDAINKFEQYDRKMIMKPMDSNSSRGVYTINDINDIIQHFDESVQFSKIEKSILLEEYIEGTEFTIDGIKTSKGHVSLAISEKKHYSYNENIACSLFFSHYNEKYDYDLLRKMNDTFVNLSGLPFGLTHAEYKYRDGKFYLIEIGARGGGNLISAIIVPTISGVDNYNYLIRKTLGLPCKEDIVLDEAYKQKGAVLNFFDTDGKEGVVKEIIGEEFLEECDNILDYALYFSVGDRIKLAADDSKRIGYYIAYGNSKNELNNIIRKVEENFRFVLEEKHERKNN